MTINRGLALAERLHSTTNRSQAKPSEKLNALAAVFANFGVELMLSMGVPPDAIEGELKKIVGAVAEVKLRQASSE